MQNTHLLGEQWLDQVKEQPVKYIWRPYFPDKATLYSGQMGIGKSYLTTAIAAHVTAGTPWPDGSPPEPEIVGGRNVMFIAEDNAADIIRPRFQAAGGDPSRVMLLEQVGQVPFKLPDHLHLLEEKIVRHHIALVIIDPIMKHITTRSEAIIDEKIMAPLAHICDVYGVCILMINHTNKTGPKSDPFRLAKGPATLQNSARVCYMVLKESTGILTATPYKFNVALPPEPFQYWLKTDRQGITTIHYQFADTSPGFFSGLRNLFK